MSAFSLFKYLKPYRVKCIVGPLFKLLEAILELYMPFLLAQVIDKGIATGDYEYVRRMSFVLVGLVVVGLCFALVCQYLASLTSQGFGTTLRNELFAKIMSFTHGEVDKYGAPTLINRITNDVNQLQFVVAMLIRLVIRAPFLCVGGIIVSFVLDWRLALIILAAIPLFILAMTVIMKKSVPLYRDVQSRLDGLSRIIRENLSGVRVIRAFGKTEGENKRFEGELDEFTKASVRVAKVSVLLNPITTLIMNAAIIAIIAVTGINASGSGDVSTGTIVALINYANQILVALIVVSNLVVTFSKAYASGNRVETDVIFLPDFPVLCDGLPDIALPGQSRSRLHLPGAFVLRIEPALPILPASIHKQDQFFLSVHADLKSPLLWIHAFAGVHPLIGFIIPSGGQQERDAVRVSAVGKIPADDLKGLRVHRLRGGRLCGFPGTAACRRACRSQKKDHKDPRRAVSDSVQNFLHSETAAPKARIRIRASKNRAFRLRPSGSSAGLFSCLFSCRMISAFII